MDIPESMAREGIYGSTSATLNLDTVDTPIVVQRSVSKQQHQHEHVSETSPLLDHSGEPLSEDYLMSTTSHPDRQTIFDHPEVQFRGQHHLRPSNVPHLPSPRQQRYGSDNNFHPDHSLFSSADHQNPRHPRISNLRHPATGGVVGGRKRRASVGSYGRRSHRGNNDTSDDSDGKSSRRSYRRRRRHDHDEGIMTNSLLGSSFVAQDRRMDNFTSSRNEDHDDSATVPNPLHRDRFRRKLKYYFMNPIDKWRAKGRLPWKLGLQVIKIIIVTLQLLTFGMSMSKYLSHQGNMIVTFRELFMSDWDPVREVMTYPPAAGPYAVYNKADFYTHINQAIVAYAGLETAIGNFGYGPVNVSATNPMSPISFCKSFYQLGIIEPSRFFFNYTNQIKESCINVSMPQLMPGDAGWKVFSIETYLNENNFTLKFDRLLKVILKFPVRTVYLNSLDPSDEPDCYDVDIVINYDNTQHDGQVLINLDSFNHKRRCFGNINHGDDYRRTYQLAALNVLVIALCSVSLILCLRSLYRGNLLRKSSVKFFDENYGQCLNFGEQMIFIDMWIVLMVVNDILIITGSGLKLIMEKHITTDSIHFSSCSLLLGVGNLLVWMGLLRYLEFFRRYNILVLTLRRALPHVLRFMLCTLLLYGGFCFCGWLVLGPYHMKFKNLSTTSECLFALLNGDDMFATFAVLDDKGQNLIWWFSRLYLYSFICLFIYVVLSLFISIIMDSYETIKEYYEHGFPLTDLQRFIAECPDDATSSIFLDDQEPDPISVAVKNFFSWITGSRRRGTYQGIQ